MKHSKKKLSEPRHPKFSFFLACFGGGQPSGKKLAFDHSKKSHLHHHRWLLSPYWSKTRLKRSTSSSKAVHFEFIGVSPPPTSMKSESVACGKASPAAASENIPLVEKADLNANLISKEALNKTRKNFEEGEEDLCQKPRKSDSKKIQVPNDFYFPGRSNNNNSAITLSKLDHLIGFSIVMLTLLIMIIWGRVCAILCTSAWFYFVPRLHFKEDKRKCQKKNLNMKLADEGKNLRMKDHKKRVILDGFLERENRQSFS